MDKKPSCNLMGYLRDFSCFTIYSSGDVMKINLIDNLYTNAKENPCEKSNTGSESFHQILVKKMNTPSADIQNCPAVADASQGDMKSIEKTGRNTLTDDERRKMAVKGQEIIKWLARRFGIPEGFMNLILQGLGIKAEDLANPETRAAALQAIIRYFQLSDEEAKELMEDFNYYIGSFDY